MALSGIISVSGLPGLHKILAHTKNGLIVESLIDGKRRPVYSTQKVSSLEDISIYTLEEDMPLKDVFKTIFDKEKGKSILDHKTDPAKLREYLTSVVKSIDHDRVYNSDVAKLFQWYNLLIEKGLMNFDEEKDEEKEKKTEKEGAKKPAAKSGPKKKAVDKAAAPKKAASQKKGAAKTAQTRSAGRNS